MSLLELPVSIIAFSSGLSALGAALQVAWRHRTPVLRWFLVFHSALLLLCASFLLWSLCALLDWVAPGSVQAGNLGLATAILRPVGLVVARIGTVVLSLILPWFVRGLESQSPALWYRRIAGASALVLAILAFVPSAGPDHTGFLAAIQLLPGILFLSNVALALGVMLRRPGLKDPTVRSLTILTAIFLPFFAFDMALSQGDWTGLRQILDNTAMPLYFLMLNIGLMSYLGRHLDHPPLLEDGSLSDHARHSYNLTKREAEVLEYVLDGYSLKDLAGVLNMAPKTAENHLYQVYQKTGVNNRVQLYQFFHNQNRNSRGF